MLPFAMPASPSHQEPSAARNAARADVSAAVPTPVSVAVPAGVPVDTHRHGSWLLASAWQRMGVALLVCAGLWALTGWAMEWW